MWRAGSVHTRARPSVVVCAHRHHTARVHSGGIAPKGSTLQAADISQAIRQGRKADVGDMHLAGTGDPTAYADFRTTLTNGRQTCSPCHDRDFLHSVTTFPEFKGRRMSVALRTAHMTGALRGSSFVATRQLVRSRDGTPSPDRHLGATSHRQIVTRTARRRRRHGSPHVVPPLAASLARQPRRNEHPMWVHGKPPPAVPDGHLVGTASQRGTGAWT